MSVRYLSGDKTFEGSRISVSKRSCQSGKDGTMKLGRKRFRTGGRPKTMLKRLPCNSLYSCQEGAESTVKERKTE